MWGEMEGEIRRLRESNLMAINTIERLHERVIILEGEKIMEMDDNKEGLICKYFVLKPRGADEYAKASRAAMMAYATHINKVNKPLANSLWDWVEKEQTKA
jgi:hypothetical protein